MSFDYKKAGVDIDTGDALVDWLQAQSESDKNHPLAKNIISGIGGFASLFKMDFPSIKKPVLITCTDGVGTKVKLAAAFNRYEEVAQDMVAMCVNDLICTGGQPLLFLDYYATGKLNLEAAQKFLTGVRKACAESNCLLVGGETAEMPGVYQGKDFDCAGFAVGLVDEDKILGPKRVQENDCVIGIASSGFHSNGFSLLRKVFANDLETWVDRLLVPTRLYVRLMQKLMQADLLHAAAHITGGGVENIPRVLPTQLRWKEKEWSIPENFLEVQRRTQISLQELKRSLNCGIGFVLIADPAKAPEIRKMIAAENFESYDLGSIEAST